MISSGYVELKNWKRLSTDEVASDPSATVEEILGDVIAIATLRIRLSSRSVKLARVYNPPSVVTSARTSTQRVNYYLVTLITSSASAELARHALTPSLASVAELRWSCPILPSRGRPELTFHSAADNPQVIFRTRGPTHPVIHFNSGAADPCSDIRYSSGWSGLIPACRGRLGVGKAKLNGGDRACAQIHHEALSHWASPDVTQRTTVNDRLDCVTSGISRGPHDRLHSHSFDALSVGIFAYPCSSAPLSSSTTGLSSMCGATTVARISSHAVSTQSLYAAWYYYPYEDLPWLASTDVPRPLLAALRCLFFHVVYYVNGSTVFSDFVAPLQDLSCGPGGWPRIFVERHGKDFFLIFWLRIVHFGLVWYMIRQLRIHF